MYMVLTTLGISLSLIFPTRMQLLESHNADFLRVPKFRQFQSRFHNSTGFLDQSVSRCLPYLH